MRSAASRVGSALAFAMALSSTLVRAADTVLSVVPHDALVVGVVHDVADVDRTLGKLAELVQAPPVPTLLGMARAVPGLHEGLDENGDLAVVLASLESGPKPLIVLPIADVEKFFGALGVKAPKSGGLVDAEIQGGPAVVGRKGNYAVVATGNDREQVEKLLAAKNTLAADDALAAWTADNKVSVVVTSHGIQALLPKLVDGIQTTREHMAAIGGKNGRIAADMMNMYVTMFTAAQTEVAQFGVGVRVDPEQTVDVHSRTQFAPDGKWAGLFADTKPCSHDLLAGLTDNGFVMAGGVTVSQTVTHGVMDMFIAMVQNQATPELSPKQKTQIAETFTAYLNGVQGVGMRMGVGEPDAGLYGDTEMVMRVANSKQYMEAYEKSLATMNTLAKEIQLPSLPAASSRRVQLDGADVIEVTMELSNLDVLADAGGPDPEAMKRLIVGPDGTIKHFITAVDDHTMVVAYTSLEKLKAAIDHFKAGKPGLSKNPKISKVSSALPKGSHAVWFVSVRGYADMVRQVMAAAPGGMPVTIPELPECAPIGMAVKASPTDIETHLVVPADVPKAISDAVQKAIMNDFPVPRDDEQAVAAPSSVQRLAR